MRILLVHRNFPGQFRYLAPALIRAGHRVGVLTWDQNQNPQPLPTARYRHEDSPARGLGGTYAQYAGFGATAARAAQALAARGDRPDIVFGSINWGETLFLREVWPDARHLGYAEFFYGTRGRDTGFDPEFSRTGLEAGIRTLDRRAHLLMAATDADALLSPTRWQAATFPAELQPKISVIHDGVDTTRIAPDPAATYQVPGGPLLKAGDEVLTFVNRNLEPYRGYHILMRALPQVMAARPDLQVVMVGSDGTGYGPGPGEGKSWKQVLLDEVGGRIDRSRLHFTGRIPYDDLLNVLRVGRAHAYLTYPFVLSWSMLEAMSLGALVVGSATPPVEEVIEDGVTGHLVDFFDVDGWAAKLIEVLSDPAAQAPVRAAARQHIIDRYDLGTVCLPRLMEFVTGEKPQG
ncbi:glycosyltransferase [Pseudoruegeria sp. HB172150]|uniref:glycosyltransferase n=1 Tax=Pseudoruegeria sp. HB172150 TaxID=2721164 RepID=UPI0015542120|nr:glycosyltransferase [Pseudoruegeria sp. HB172150]